MLYTVPTVYETTSVSNFVNCDCDDKFILTRHTA